MERRGGTYNPAKGKPRMRLDDVTGHVAAPVAWCHDAFVAGYGLAECMLAAHEEEEHLYDF
jgi:hypothetical protein